MRGAWRVPVAALVGLMAGAGAATAQESPHFDVRCETPAGRPPNAAIAAFVNTYYRAWTERDSTGYVALFDSAATIVQTRKGATVEVVGLGAFLKGTFDFLRRPDQAAEWPASCVAAEFRGTASLEVGWRFRFRGDTLEGISRFTVVQRGDGTWRIVSLTWESFGT